jgi:hypothetical protein
MTPEVPQIAAMLKDGSATVEQAEQWLGTIIDSAIERTALRDTFAAMAAIGRDSEGNLLKDSVIAVMGQAIPPLECETVQDRLKWWATAEARIRYAKADAMMEARLL